MRSYDLTFNTEERSASRTPELLLSKNGNAYFSTFNAFFLPCVSGYEEPFGPGRAPGKLNSALLGRTDDLIKFVMH